MRGCTDKRFREALHSYELGLLDGDELEAFQLHLFDCEQCFRDVQEFHQAAQHLTRSEAIKKTVYAFDEALRESDVSASKEHPAFSRKKLRWGLLTIAAAVLLTLVLEPWDIEFHPVQQATAAENRLLVTCIENLSDATGKSQLGKIVANLLITDLAESRYVQVVSDQRLFDLLAARNLEPSCPLDPGVALNIARQIHARWLLSGAILRDQPPMVITSQLIDVSTGTVAATMEVTGDSADGVFSLVDKLTVAVKSDLRLPPGALTEADPKISDVTTSSPEAYSYYIEGIDNKQKLFYAEATADFKKALEYDSTFAMAYYHLAVLGDPSCLKRAVEYAKHATGKERHYILSLQAMLAKDYDTAIKEIEEIIRRYPDEKDAYYKLGDYRFTLMDYEKAIEAYTAVLEIDPFFGPAYNQLTYCYDRLGDFEKSIWAANKYVDLAPDEPNPYDTRGEIYANFGKPDQAIESFRKSLEIKGDFAPPRIRLGLMYLFTGDYGMADSCLLQVTRGGSMTVRMLAELARAYLPARQGFFDSAVYLIDRFLEDTEFDKPQESMLLSAYLFKVLCHRARHEFGPALDELERAMAISDSWNPDLPIKLREIYVQLLAESGDIDAATEQLGILKGYVAGGMCPESMYWYAGGCLELARGNYSEAVEYLTGYADHYNNRSQDNYFQGHTMLALAHLKAGSLEQAAGTFEELHASYTGYRAYWSIWDVLIYYYLGLTYEQSRWYENATANYEKFLEYWQDSNPDLPEVRDAAERLARLNQQP